MRCRFITLLIDIAAVAASVASPIDTALVEHTTLGRLTEQESLRNPAIHGAAYLTSFSQLTLGVDLLRQSEAFIPEKGTGYTLPYLQVTTHLRLNAHSSVWGEASYTTGRQYDITWNSTSDYDLLQPYILADTSGGGTRHERYCFSGGWGTRANRWLAGVEMKVRAEQEYRRLDPRMRGVVVDLTLRGGAGYEMSRYRVGAAVETNIYKQTNSVAFYHEEGVIPEYQMTGLGTEYSRFSGDKRSVYHDGGGMALLLHGSPLNGSGVYGDMVLEEHRYHRKLSEYNAMPLTDLYNHHMGATIGWKRQVQSRRTALYGHVDWTRRTGNEHVIGTSDGQRYPVVATMTMYKNDIVDAHAGVLYGKGCWNLALKGGFMSHKEEYVYPRRQLNSQHVYGTLQGQCFLRHNDKLLFTVQAHVAGYCNVGDKLLMPLANMSAPVIALIRHKHDYATANYTDLGAKLRADMPLKSSSHLGLFGQIAGGLVLCSTSEHESRVQAAIGLTF